jgi:hypothetical protein
MPSAEGEMPIDPKQMGAFARRPLVPKPGQPQDEMDEAGEGAEGEGEGTAPIDVLRGILESQGQAIQAAVEQTMPGLSPEVEPDDALVQDLAEALGSLPQGLAEPLAAAAAGCELEQLLALTDELAASGALDPEYATAVGTFLFLAGKLAGAPAEGGEGEAEGGNGEGAGQA